MDGLQAVRAVIPPSVPMYMVGGVGPDTFKSWKDAGADGFGIGSALYKPGRGVSDIQVIAKEMVAAYDDAVST